MRTNVLETVKVNSTAINEVKYDIENNKVRTRVSKYLEKQGCIRIQKSIFLTNTESKNFNQIYETILEVQS